MRQTMIFSSLETISFNLRRRNGNLKIFDLGKTYFKEGDSSMEKWVLSFSLCGNTHEETWQSKSKPFNLFNLREDISDILMSLGVLDLKLVPFNDETFDWGLRFMKGNVIISTIGKLSNKTKSVYSIKEEVFYGEIDWDYLTSREVKAIKFNHISKYPLVRRDLSLIIDDVVSYSDIMEVCKIGGLLKSMGVIDVYKNDKLLKGKKE